MNYRSQNTWKSIATEEFVQTVYNLSSGLLNLGIKKGEKIGIISNPSPFWIMADLAIVIAGYITVPVFKRISPENLEFEINDSELNVIFIGDEDEFEHVKTIGKRIKKIITIGFDKDDAISVSFENVVRSGKNNPNISCEPSSIKEDDIFTVIYTSGSTGIPKGVMLTHRNIISQIKGAPVCYGINADNDIAMSSLPLSHIFERMVVYFYLFIGLPIYFVDEDDRFDVIKHNGIGHDVSIGMIENATAWFDRYLI